MSKPKLNLLFLGSATHSVGETTATYNFGSFGPGGALNYVFVALFYGTEGTRLPSTVTLDGVAATRVLRANVSTSRGVDIWWAQVTTPVAGNIVVNFGGSNNSACAAWNVVGNIDTANIVVDTSGTSPYGPTLTSKVGGVGLLVGCGSTAMSGVSPTADASGANTLATTFQWAASSAVMNALTWSPTMSGSLPNFGSISMWNK